MESDEQDYVDNVIKNMRNLGLFWKGKWPEEQIDAEYLKDNLDRDHNGFAFIADAVKNRRVIKGSSRVPRKLKGQTSCVVHGCFYNALDFMHRFSSEFPKMKLAYGIMTEPSTFADLKKFANTEPKDMLQASSKSITHAFLLNGKKIIDPTMGSQQDYYFYDTVPESVWRKFNYKAGDTNWDARDFANFIHKRIDKMQASFPFAKKLKAIGGI